MDNLKHLRDEIARYTSLDAPSGYEEPVLAAVKEDLQQCCDHVEVDIRGNVYGHQPGEPNGPKLMITAHADEIGFQITSILPNGFLRFCKIGGPTSMVLPGQRVKVLAGQKLAGVIGVRPGHVLTPAEARQVPSTDQLYIDVGACSASQACEWGIEPGTPAVFDGELTATANPDRYFGKSVDNRMGIVSVLEVARRLQAEATVATRCYAIVVEEEVGLRGALVAAQHLSPDVVIAIDTTPAGGTPDLATDQLPWHIGQGPLLKVRETRGVLTHGPLREWLRQIAAKLEIPYQLIVDTAGVTDATSAQQAGSQIAATVIGLARRYSHSAVEMFDLPDVERIIQWTTAAARELTSMEPLRRV